MKNVELISFAGTWLYNWEGRRVAVPIFLCKIIIRKFGAETCQPSLNIWGADPASLP